MPDGLPGSISNPPGRLRALLIEVHLVGTTTATATGSSGALPSFDTAIVLAHAGLCMLKPATVDEYLAQVPEPARTTLSKIRAQIRALVPAETTEAISYGMPAFKYKGGLIGYAAFKNHCSLFPMNSTLVKTFAEELKNYATDKGTIRFPIDKPLPAALVKKIVLARIAENENKKKR